MDYYIKELYNGEYVYRHYYVTHNRLCSGGIRTKRCIKIRWYRDKIPFVIFNDVKDLEVIKLLYDT